MWAVTDSFKGKGKGAAKTRGGKELTDLWLQEWQ
jgi:hypothetical protein